MKIYFKTRGDSQKQGYSWKITEPPLMKERQITSLIDHDFFSIVLGRYNNNLYLLITGLESKKNKYGNSSIENSVLWESHNESEEKDLIHLAALGLQDHLKNQLESKIDDAIKLNPDKEDADGFAIDFNKIEPKIIIDKLSKVRNDESTESIISNDKPNSNYLAPDNLERKQKLASELKELASEDTEMPELLKENNRIFVVVTQNATESQFKQAKVWRGISNLIEAKLEITHDKELRKNVLGRFFTGIHRKDFRLVIVGLALILVVSAYPLYSSSLINYLSQKNKPSIALLVALMPSVEHVIIKPCTTQTSIPPSTQENVTSCMQAKINQPILLQGYSQQAEKVMYSLENQENELSPAQLSLETKIWQVNLNGFKTAGEYKIQVQEFNKEEQVISKKIILINVDVNK